LKKGYQIGASVSFKTGAKLFKYLFLILLIFPLAYSALAYSANAQDSTSQKTHLEPLIKAMQLKGVMASIRIEGMQYGKELGQKMLQGRGGDEWLQIVATIYNENGIWDTFYHRLALELQNHEIDEMLAFWQTDIAKQAVGLEISARLAFMDKDIEETARARFREMAAAKHPRATMLREFVEAGDLVQYNLSSAMNSSYAFSLGMVQGGAFKRVLTEEEILRSTWENEAEIRTDITEWLYAYLALAYQPMSDAQLQTYIGFSKTKAGRKLNAAQFAAYDDVFNQVSKALGLAAAQFLRGSDL